MRKSYVRLVPIAAHLELRLPLGGPDASTIRRWCRDGHDQELYGVESHGSLTLILRQTAREIFWLIMP